MSLPRMITVLMAVYSMTCCGNAIPVTTSTIEPSANDTPVTKQEASPAIETTTTVTRIQTNELGISNTTPPPDEIKDSTEESLALSGKTPSTAFHFTDAYVSIPSPTVPPSLPASMPPSMPPSLPASLLNTGSGILDLAVTSLPDIENRTINGENIDKGGDATPLRVDSDLTTLKNRNMNLEPDLPLSETTRANGIVTDGNTKQVDETSTALPIQTTRPSVEDNTANIGDINLQYDEGSVASSLGEGSADKVLANAQGATTALPENTTVVQLHLKETESPSDRISVTTTNIPTDAPEPHDNLKIGLEVSGPPGAQNTPNTTYLILDTGISIPTLNSDSKSDPITESDEQQEGHDKMSNVKIIQVVEFSTDETRNTSKANATVDTSYDNNTNVDNPDASLSVQPRGLEDSPVQQKVNNKKDNSEKDPENEAETSASTEDNTISSGKSDNDVPKTQNGTSTASADETPEGEDRDGRVKSFVAPPTTVRVLDLSEAERLFDDIIDASTALDESSGDGESTDTPTEEETHKHHDSDGSHDDEHIEADMGSSHHEDTPADKASKKRTAIIIGVAVGGVALFSLAFFASRRCKEKRKFKAMKRTHSSSDPEGIEFRPVSSYTPAHNGDNKPTTATTTAGETNTNGGLHRHGPRMGPPSPRFHRKSEGKFQFPSSERLEPAAAIPLLSESPSQTAEANGLYRQGPSSAPPSPRMPKKSPEKLESSPTPSPKSSPIQSPKKKLKSTDKPSTTGASNI